MKKIILIIGVILFTTSCLKKNPIETYHGDKYIYFKNDKRVVTFAFTPNKSDSLIKIPVAVTGRMSQHNRKYVLQLADSSTAKKGKDFDYLDDDFTIPANSLVDTIKITLYKTTAMDTDSLRIALKLKANKNFTPNLREVESEGAKSLNKYNLYATNVLTEPYMWYSSYLGEFTAEKFNLMAKVLKKVDFSRWALGSGLSDPGGFRIPDIIHFGVVMQRYLDKQTQNGHPVYEEDGSLMRMGSNVQ
jgi:hypothetical protein